jgi:hypothetical protein
MFLRLVERLEDSGCLTEAEEIAATILSDAVMAFTDHAPGTLTPEYVVQLERRSLLRFKVWYDRSEAS